MTGSNRGSGGSMGPPWSVDLLADLQAGVLSPAETQQLWAQVNSDPQAKAVLRALDSTTGSLRELGTAPVAPMPAQYAARLDAAIAAEARAMTARQAQAAPGPAAGGPAPVIDLAEARRKRNRRLSIGAGLVAAAAAVAAVAIAVIPGSGGGTTGGVAEPGPTATQPAPGGSDAPLAVQSSNMGAALGQTQNKHELGALGDESTLAACRQANGVPDNAQTVGVRPVTLDGKPAMLLVLTTGQTAKFRLLFVGEDCAVGNPAKIADTTVGGLPTTR